MDCACLATAPDMPCFMYWFKIHRAKYKHFFQIKRPYFSLAVRAIGTSFSDQTGLWRSILIFLIPCSGAAWPVYFLWCCRPAVVGKHTKRIDRPEIGAWSVNMTSLCFPFQASQSFLALIKVFFTPFVYKTLHRRELVQAFYSWPSPRCSIRLR